MRKGSGAEGWDERRQKYKEWNNSVKREQEEGEMGEEEEGMRTEEQEKRKYNRSYWTDNSILNETAEEGNKMNSVTAFN